MNKPLKVCEKICRPNVRRIAKCCVKKSKQCRNFCSPVVKSLLFYVDISREHLYCIKISLAVFSTRALGNSTTLISHVEQHIFNVALKPWSNKVYTVPIFVGYLIICYLIFFHKFFFNCSAIA